MGVGILGKPVGQVPDETASRCTESDAAQPVLRQSRLAARQYDRQWLAGASPGSDKRRVHPAALEPASLRP